MPAGVIQLLSDTISSQIAAGEVIQRPASAVKELLENAIDAGASRIQLIVKNAGKSAIQVIDDGCGMSETDARMCFEKHATSKIRNIDDLFQIRTMGFRGEALASIGAVAQVELKTKLESAELASKVQIEGGKVISQEYCQHATGTSINLRNLFYNIPARRNFLKSNPVELKHILEEFQRVAIANPKVQFEMSNDEHTIFHLPASNLRQRITAIFGEKYNERLVPVNEQTEILDIFGFVGKPEFARRTRGEQYLFVNNRFVKSAYLNHAIFGAFRELIPKEQFPLFVLFLELDPAKIDINVHPSKHEVKFEEEKLVYTFVNAAIKHALAQFSVTPTLDFDQDSGISSLAGFNNQKPPSFDESVRAFNADFRRTEPDHRDQSNQRNWQELYNISLGDQSATHTVPSDTETPRLIKEKEDTERQAPYQIHNRYIISPIKSGFILIDQKAAHERILFERFKEQLLSNRNSSQPQLFPEPINLSKVNAQILTEILPEINSLGFDIQPFGENSFVVHAFPADVAYSKETDMIDSLIEQFKMNKQIGTFEKRDNVAMSLAKSSSIPPFKRLAVEEMQQLIDELFACSNPYSTPNGRRTFITFDHGEIDRKFAIG